MKKLIYLFAFTLLNLSVIAQNFKWAKRMGSTSADEANSMSIDSFGNVYTSGYFQGTVDFNPGTATYNLTSAGSTDIFISKLDSLGNFKWAKRIGNSLSDIAHVNAIDNYGNIYIAGIFEGNVDFDPGSGTSYLTSAKYRDGFILKLDSTGNFIWAKCINGAGNQFINAICLDKSGNIYATGYFSDSADFDPGVGKNTLISRGLGDIFILKLNSTGSFSWAKKIGGKNNDLGASITIDKNRNIYIGGEYGDTVDFDPGSGTYNLTGYNSFISKFDTSGKFIWAKATGGVIDINSSMPDGLGNIYFSGGFRYTTDFDPGTGTYNLSAADMDIFILKLDTNGKFIWAKKFGYTSGDESFSLAIDNSGNIYTTGLFEGIIDFDPGTGTYNLSSSTVDAFILKLNSSGNFVWAIKIGGTSGVTGKSIKIDPLGNVYCLGRFYKGTADFDPGSGTFNMTSAGDMDIFIVKLCNAPPQAGTITGKIAVCPSSQETYSINSISGVSGYTWTVPPGATISSGQNSKSITVTFGTTSGNITVTTVNSCGNGAPKTLAITIGPLKVITTEPINKTANSGSDVKFTFKSSSTSATYQWQENSGSGFKDISNGGQYSGVTNDTLIISNVTLSQNNYIYHCIAKEVYCSDTTNNALLKVICPKNISKQPTNQTVNAGAKVLFTLTSPSTTTTYQWQQNSGTGFVNLSNGGQYSGVLNDTLTINSVKLSQSNYNYRCILKDGECNDTSAVVLLKTSCASIVTTEPSNQTINFGSNAIFILVAASSTATYQWQENPGSGFVNLSNSGQYSGVTSKTLTITGAKPSQSNYKYRCIAQDGECNDTTKIVSLKVNCVPITTEPSNQTKNIGSNASFILTSLNTTANYQWQENPGSGFINLSNAGQYSGVTSKTLTINSVKFSQSNYKYRCVIQDGECSDTSINVLLKVNCIPIISAHPSNQNIDMGLNALFIVTSLSTTATYQWQENTGIGFANLSNGGQYSGVTEKILKITKVQLSQSNNKYRCMAKDGGCPDSSISVLLTVKPVGIETIKYKNDFDIFPNPANDQIFIKGITKGDLIIFDISGKEVLRTEVNNTEAIDISKLNKGTYFIRCSDGSSSYNGRFVKVM